MEQEEQPQLKQPEPQEPINNPLQPSLGSVPYHTHNGVDGTPRLNANNIIGLQPGGLPGIFTYYVSATSGGSPTVKLTFTNGILTNNT